MTAATAGGLERPSLTYKMKLEDGEKEIKLTYGLFQDLQRVVPDPSTMVDTILVDAEARDYIMRRCLTDSKKMITNLDELIKPEDVTLEDPDEQEKLLRWVTGHLLYFFATSAGSLKQLSVLLAQRLKTDQPAPSTSGSPA